MWIREAGRALRRLQGFVERAASIPTATQARRETPTQEPLCPPGPALTDAMLWGAGRWGEKKWGPERYRPNPTHWIARWNLGRWNYAFWGHPRTRA